MPISGIYLKKYYVYFLCLAIILLHCGKGEARNMEEQKGLLNEYEFSLGNVTIKFSDLVIEKVTIKKATLKERDIKSTATKR